MHDSPTTITDPMKDEGRIAVQFRRQLTLRRCYSRYHGSVSEVPLGLTREHVWSRMQGITSITTSSPRPPHNNTRSRGPPLGPRFPSPSSTDITTLLPQVASLRYPPTTRPISHGLLPKSRWTKKHFHSMTSNMTHNHRRIAVFVAPYHPSLRTRRAQGGIHPSGLMSAQSAQ